MESPPEDQRNREETPTVKETMHKTKIIQFFGRTTPIILQNDNGPCPLLAICNILLLRNNLSLSSDITEVSQEKLLSLVAERLIDSNSNVNNKDAGYIENQQQNIADAIDLLPRLATGIDVNIKFTGFNEFEFTRECAIFDLLDIPLYHGWIVDPQDSETANAIGSKSYNTLMGELVALESQILESDSKKNLEEDSVDFSRSSPQIVTDEKFQKGDSTEESELLKALKLSETNGTVQVPTAADSNDDLITFEEDTGKEVSLSVEGDKESGNGQMNISVSEKHEVDKTSSEVSTKTEDEKVVDELSLKSDVKEVENINIGEEKSDELCSSAPNVVVKSSKDITQVMDEPKLETCETSTTTNEGLNPKDENAAKRGELIKNFLKNSASQLTIYGLFSLQEGLKERELCVFFRNNHFNTMFKFEGELYILATDQGYLNQPDLVWEKLNEVNGDTVFMTSNFKKFKVESHETRTWDEQNAMANTADYLAKIDNTSQGETGFSSDLQLAIALQQQEFEQQQQQQPQRAQPQSPITSRSGLVVGPQHVHPARPRNSSASSRQEAKQSKDKCIVM